MSSNFQDSLTSTVGEFLGIPAVFQRRLSYLERSSEDPYLSNKLLPRPTLPIDTYRFLEKKGAFTVPNSQGRRAIVVGYLKWMHPVFPVLDLSELLSEIFCVEADQSLGPFLTQAILLAGTLFVDLNMIKRCGFICRSNMLNSFFDRAKWLYELDVETDPFRLIPGLLLMTYWHDINDPNPKDPRHWLGLAVSKAQISGLFPPFHQVDEATNERRQRLWACLYLRDQSLSLAMGLPPLIREVSASHVNLADFEISPLPRELINCLPSSLLPFLTPESRRRAKEIHCQKFMLSTHINDLLCEMFPLSSSPTTRTSAIEKNTYFPTALVPAQSFSRMNMKRFLVKLRGWIHNLPGTSRYYSPLLSVPLDFDSPDAYTVVFRADLHLLYSATLIGICICIREQPRVTVIVKRLILKITNVLSDLSGWKLHLYIPHTVVTVLGFVLTVHSQFTDVLMCGDFEALFVDMLKRYVQIAEDLVEMCTSAETLKLRCLRIIRKHLEKQVIQ